MKKILIMGFLILGSLSVLAEEIYCGKVTGLEIAGDTYNDETVYAHITLDSALVVSGVMKNSTFESLQSIAEHESKECLRSGNAPGDTYISIMNY
jgi:hypothetical protein